MKMQKKYRIIKDKRMVQSRDGRSLYIIQALIDIPERNVRAGDYGGWIESEKNLSQRGTCWIERFGYAYGNAQVYEDALVQFYCEVKDNAKVHGHAEIRSESTICEDAEIYDWATIRTCIVGGHAKIYEYAEIVLSECRKIKCIGGNSRIHGHARVSPYARIDGEVDISGDAEIHPYAIISGKAKIDGKAIVRKYAEVRDNAHIGENAILYEGSKAYGNADITGDVEVAEGASVFGNAELSGNVFVHETVSVSGFAVVSQGRLARDWSGDGAPPPYWVATWGMPSLGTVCFMRNTGGICSNCDKEVKQKDGYLPSHCPVCGAYITEIIRAPRKN